MALRLRECDVFVDARFCGEAKDALADDVALNLVAAACDAVAGRTENVLAPCVGAPLAVVDHNLGAEDLRDDIACLGHSRGPHQLAERTLWPRGLSGAHACGNAAVRVLRGAQGGIQLGDLLTDDRVVEDSGPPRGSDDLLERAAGVAAGRAARVVTLEAEAGECDAPALADGPEAELIGNAHVGEEHLVEVGTSRHLLDRTYLDTLPVEGDHECSEALVLGDVEVAAGDGETPFGKTRTRGPHLLAVQHPFITVTRGASGERCKVGPGARFGEELASADVHAHDRLAPLLLLLGSSECGHGWCDETHRGGRQLAGGRDDELAFLGHVGANVTGRQSATAEFLGPVDHRVTGVELLCLPRLHRVEASEFFFVGEVVEDGDVVRAFAPHDLLVLFFRFVDLWQRFGILLEPHTGFLAELVDVGKSAHGQNASSHASACASRAPIPCVAQSG